MVNKNEKAKTMNKEEEAEKAKKEAEDEATKGKTSKTPVHEEDGEMVKDAEGEDEAGMKKEAEDEDEDCSAMTKEEHDTYMKLKSKVKKVKKSEGSGQDPEESAEDGNTDSHTTTPGYSVQSEPKQQVMPGNTQVKPAREQHMPMDNSPTVTKGVTTTLDFQKSPLFKSFSQQVDELKKSANSKIESLEKSINDRLDNIMKEMSKVDEAQKKIEKFYSHSFYKAVGENTAPEGMTQERLSEKINKGVLRTRG